MKQSIVFAVCCLLSSLFLPLRAQTLPGFKNTGLFNEQEMSIIDTLNKITVNIVAPLKLNPKAATVLVFYALPNGNSIEWTKGKKPQPGDDWHFDIQHIAAQMRFVRELDKKKNYIIVYLMAAQKSWPAWKRNTPNALYTIKRTVDSITAIFSAYQPSLVLNGHSGGGSFIFGFLDAVDEVPSGITRIAFLDSDYGYNDTLHSKKLFNWLNRNTRNKLLVLAYNDSVVMYNGKPLVSPTGGTWYRSRLMQQNLSTAFKFRTVEDTSFIVHRALGGRVQIILKKNPQALIYHTVQVEKNGFILSLLSGTKFRKYFTYFGEKVYTRFITD